MARASIANEERFGRLQLFWDDRQVGIYNYHGFVTKPYFYPIIGPGGKNLIDDQPADHLHHRGVWYAHHEVNGHDFYLERGAQGVVRHEGFEAAWHEEGAAGVAARNTWLSKGGEPVMTDVRTIAIRDLRDRLPGVLAWALDLTITLIATEGPVEFSDTKEAGLPLVRVADHLDEFDGGTITLADGSVGEEATFGAASPWIDYSAPVGGQSGRDKERFPSRHGIAILDHPSNPGWPPRVFTRSYGPISTREGFMFEGGKRLASGDRYTLAHRIYIHSGDAREGRVDEAYAMYAGEAPWVLST